MASFRSWRKSVPDKLRQESTKTSDELLVFGYACKLFRDDEKARFIDRGKHLIPWMGDESHMIDRYDGRGHLFDLSQYEADVGSTARQLSEEEERIEKLCDEERYLALYKDLLEEEAKQEEELKRLHEALQEDGTYHSLGYNYDNGGGDLEYDPTQPTEEETEDAGEVAGDEDDDDEINEEPFIAPEELKLPRNIETPMTQKMHAIIEKTAWFVTQNGVQMEIVIKTKQGNNSQFAFMHYDHYLHPYYEHMKKFMKDGKYKPLGHLRDRQNSGSSDDDNDESGGYLHPSLFAKKHAQERNSHLANLRKLHASGQIDSPYAQLAKQMKQLQQDYGTANVQTSSPASSERLENVPESRESSVNSPSSITDSPQYVMHPDYSTASDMSIYPAMYPDCTAVAELPAPPGTTDTSLPAPAASLVTSSEPSHTESAIVPPPPDIQPVVDKMAEYAAKHGVQFEKGFVVKAGLDPRFDFVKPGHVHYAYYLTRRTLFEAEAAKKKQISQQQTAIDSVAPTQADSVKQKTSKAAAVSFSIKPRDGESKPRSLEKPALQLDEESSDNSDTEGSRSRLSYLSDEPATASALSLTNEQTHDVVVPVATPVAMETVIDDEKTVLLDEADKIKLAEERLKDKLAIAAREKLAQASKEKQLQMERKRKAAMFLNLLKSEKAEVEDEISKSSSRASSRVSSPSSTPSYVSSSEQQSSSVRPVKAASLAVGLAALRKQRSRSRSRSRSSKKRKPLPSAYISVRRSLTPERRRRSRSRGRCRQRSPSRERKKRSGERCKRRSRSRSTERNKSHKSKRESRSGSPTTKKAKSGLSGSSQHKKEDIEVTVRSGSSDSSSS